MLFHFTSHFCCSISPLAKKINQIFGPFGNFQIIKSICSLLTKAYKKFKDTSDKRYYASYLIYIYIYSDFVPFHPALPSVICQQMTKCLWVPFSYFIINDIGQSKLYLNNAKNGGRLKKILYSSLISTQHSPTFGHSILPGIWRSFFKKRSIKLIIQNILLSTNFTENLQK